jgi:mono/diheme cytochrome c family protein
MQTTRKSLGAAALTTALLAGTCLLGSPAKADQAAAEAIYKPKCAGCHGADGKGKAAMKTRDWASADVQKMSDADLANVITNGKAPMPPFKTLSADQVKDLVAYVRTFAKK